MKNLMFMFATFIVAMMFTACTNGKTSETVTTDSTTVDSVTVVDSMIVDSTSVDSVTNVPSEDAKN